jgi:hypothetical protein
MNFFAYDLFIGKLYLLRQDIPNVVGLALIVQRLNSIEERLSRVIPDAPAPPAPMAGDISAPTGTAGSNPPSEQGGNNPSSHSS